MMFVASKVLSFALQPLVWALGFLLAGLILRHWRQRLGLGLCWAALAALVLSGWTLPPDLLLRRLESRYPALPVDADVQRFVGVVVLGGALTNSRIWEAYQQVALNEQAERMTAAVGLLRKHPHLKALYTGGIASVPPEGRTEAQRARQFFDEMGVDPKRMLYEDRSRNTAENATFSATVPSVDPRQPWLLLTSANHMPRSMGVFVKAGWNVTPYPVDYRNDGTLDWLDFSLDDGPRDWRLVLHELLGYYVYRWNGKL